MSVSYENIHVLSYITENNAILNHATDKTFESYIIC